jgi:dihydropteroate synthase
VTWQGSCHDVTAAVARPRAARSDVAAELTAATGAGGRRRGAARRRARRPDVRLRQEHPHGLALLRHLGRLVATGRPVLVALSNKDLIGETLGVGARDRLAGTLAATAIAAHAGAAVFRAYDVPETREAVEAVAAAS